MFDKLYAPGGEDRVTMPWSRTDPHPLLVQWAHRTGQTGAGRTAIPMSWLRTSATT